MPVTASDAPLAGDWASRIQDILEVIAKIRRYVSRTDFETFKNDEAIMDAMVHNLTVIGGAANHIPSDIKTLAIEYYAPKCPANSYLPDNSRYITSTRLGKLMAPGLAAVTGMPKAPLTSSRDLPSFISDRIFSCFS